MPKRDKWLLLGGSGQLGRAVIHLLETSGKEFASPSSSEVDLRNLDQIRKDIERFEPTIILNCAAWTNVVQAEVFPEEATLLNALAPSVLASTARDMHAKFIHISTDYVFSGDNLAEYGEDDPVCPINEYGKSKALGESLIIESGLDDFYILRTAWLYSSTGRNFLKTILRNFLTTENEIRIVNDQFGNPTFAGDLALKILGISQTSAMPGIYHAVNSGFASWYDFAYKTFEYLSFETSRLVPIQTPLGEPLKRPMNSRLRIEKLGQTEVEIMQPWENALRDNAAVILNEVQKEIKNGI